VPIYEYRCERCGHPFEQMVRMSDPAPPCPKCGAGDVRKLVSASSFVLKGGGWYRDHYGLKSGGGTSEGSSSSGGGE
jgi:putative FmdB family regulatory protein